MTMGASSRRLALITARVPVDWLNQLRAVYPSVAVEYRPPETNEPIPDALWRDVDILYTSFATALPTPEQAPRLRWVQLYSAGVDTIADRPLFRSPTLFTTASGVHGVNMAEYVFAMILAFTHRLPAILEWQRAARWPQKAERASIFTAEEARGKTIGIVGYGSVGREIARLAAAFGMRVLAMHRSDDHRAHGYQFGGVGDPGGTLPERFYTPDALHSMLADCDIVVSAIPLNRHTRALFDAAAFQAMKPTAFFVNVARGDVCDEAALARALEEKRIAGAALDVFQVEPLPAENPLWKLPNVFISPHVSGLTPHYDERAAAIFQANLGRFLAGEPLHNLVDKMQYD